MNSPASPGVEEVAWALVRCSFTDHVTPPWKLVFGNNLGTGTTSSSEELLVKRYRSFHIYSHSLRLSHSYSRACSIVSASGSTAASVTIPETNEACNRLKLTGHSKTTNFMNSDQPQSRAKNTNMIYENDKTSNHFPPSLQTQLSICRTEMNSIRLLQQLASNKTLPIIKLQNNVLPFLNLVSSSYLNNL